VVVTDFHIVGFAIDKSEADTPLIVDGYRMLTISISAKRVQPITWRHPEVAQDVCCIKLFQLP